MSLPTSPLVSYCTEIIGTITLDDLNVLQAYSVILRKEVYYPHKEKMSINYKSVNTFIILIVTHSDFVL